jgi:hypothetical protein
VSFRHLIRTRNSFAALFLLAALFCPLARADDKDKDKEKPEKAKKEKI